jgi:Putative auto-transporter adhesin, head GIN domain
MTVAPTPLHRRRMPHRHQLVWIVGLVALVLVGIGVALLVMFDVFGSSSTSTAIQGSGIAATQTRDVPDFSGVDLAGSNNVTIQVGGEQSVVVHADDNLLDNVTTEVQAGTLVIANTDSFTTKSPMSVEITVPTLETLDLSGSGKIAADDIRASGLTATLSGSGTLRASGTADRLVVTLDGSGDAQLEQLVAQDAKAVVNGSGRIVVNATNSLEASVPGTGAIVYSGNPAHVTKTITGTGAITQK